MRIPGVGQVLLEGFSEVRALVLLGAQPAIPFVGEHGVQQHQSFDEASQGCGLPMSVVRLTDGFVQRLELHVIKPSAVERARRDRRGVAGRDELRQEVVCLLTVRETSEGAVLAFEEYAREDLHVHEKPRLALGEPKAHERANPRRADAVAEAYRNRFHHTKSSATRGSKARPPRRPLP
jgi:hypothetical protein